MSSVSPSLPGSGPSALGSIPPKGAARRHSGRLKLLVRVAVSLALLVAILSRIEPGQLRQALGHAHPTAWVGAWLAYLASQAVSARRWMVLAQAAGLECDYRRCLRLYFEGMFFSLGLPGSMGGDVYKAIRLAGGWSGGWRAGLSVAGDRGFGLVAVALLALVGWLKLHEQLGWATAAGLAWVLLVTAWLGFLGAWHGLAAAARRGQLPERVRRLVQQPGVRSPGRTLAEALGLSLGVQLLNVLTVALIGGSLGLGIQWEAYLFAVPTVALLAALPVTVGGLGMREGGLGWLLAGRGATSAEGLLLGLLWFAVIAVASLLGGLVFLVGRRRAATSPPPDNSRAMNAARGELRNRDGQAGPTSAAIETRLFTDEPILAGRPVAPGPG